MGTTYKAIDEPDVPVGVDRLIIGARLPCPFFVREGGATRQLFNRDMLYTAVSQSLLREKGVTELYIYMKDAPHFEAYLGTHRRVRKEREADDAAAFKEYAFAKEQYHQIDRSLILPGSKLGFTLYALNKLELTPLFELTRQHPEAVADDALLSVEGDLLIKKADIHRYREYLSSLWRSAAAPAEAAKTDGLTMKSLAVKETSKIVLKELLDDPRSGEKIKEINPLVNEMIECVLANNDAIYDLLSLGGYDYYTYTHSVNVAALAIGLGVATGMKRGAVEKLGIGAMLHDIGKSAISSEILNKQGKLGEGEYKIIQSHVVEGERILKTHKDFPGEAYSAVLQHHEKLSGKGYPLKLSGAEIKPFGRITAIADCYDALTTRRPYKPAMTPFYALSVIAKETGDYDPELLKVFIKMLGKIK